MRNVFLVSCVVVIGLFLTLFYLVIRVSALPSNHGKKDTRLFLSDSSNQPLVVAFGGGEGGNDWERHYLKVKRDEFLERGFAVLAIGYFKTDQYPNSVDRISLNALSDTILNIARRHP